MSWYIAETLLPFYCGDGPPAAVQVQWRLVEAACESAVRAAAKEMTEKELSACNGLQVPPLSWSFVAVQSLPELVPDSNGAVPACHNFNPAAAEWHTPENLLPCPNNI
jgi:hypothetical protein